MNRRHFLGRAFAGALALIGLPRIVTALPIAAPVVERVGNDLPLFTDFVDDEFWGEFTALYEAGDPVDPAVDPWSEWVTACPRERFTLRSWRVMTHGDQATAEERRLAALSWERP